MAGKKLLMMWCRKCERCTEHAQSGTMLSCKRCRSARTVQAKDKVRSPFGAGGRGF